ncbi:hypothetical protein GCM10027019_28660 [Melaminivora jejuensis]
MLGFALRQDGKIEAALVAYAKAAALWPQDAELLINYSDLLLMQGLNNEALPLLEKVVALRPEHSICWVKLSQCCYALLLHERGYEASQQALATAQGALQRVDALTQSAIHRRELGQVREAVQDCREAISLVPDAAHLYTNCLLFMLADPSCTANDLAEMASSFSERFEKPLQPHWPSFAAKDRSPWRRLRIGVVSPDFRNHAVMYFTEGLLAQLDRQQFEVIAFYNHPVDDLVTTRVQCHVDEFIRIHGMSAEKQAQTIMDADIDIAIDLAGHTGGNALLALMRKPAPVQVSTIGFPGTTGMKSMDWWISDAILDPHDAQQWYSERLYRLPIRAACYRPMIRNPLWRYQPAYQVRPTPALENGYITFGSCNNLGKLTDDVLRLWGSLLQIVPGSRLLIEGKNLEKEDIRTAYTQRCALLGIPADRLDLVNMNTANQYLTYHRIDIALDPFPLTGGTSSNDLLWMGVPLVTLKGDGLRGRMSSSILAYMGRHEWIARNQEEYLHIASTLAADITALNDLRQNLRLETEASSVMREDLYAYEIGKALRTMWLHWLEQSDHPEWTPAQVDERVLYLMNNMPAAPDTQEFLIGVAPGSRIPLSQTYQKLQNFLDLAKNGPPPLATQQAGSDVLSNKFWIKATELAESILCAKPHDPVALTVLAEIENAHGHLDFGRVYLQEALQALNQEKALEPAVEQAQKYAQAASAYWGETFCSSGTKNFHPSTFHQGN